MNHDLIVRAALAGLFALGVSGTAFAQPKPMPQGTEKCYGIAKAGQNDCASGAIIDARLLGTTSARIRPPRSTAAKTTAFRSQ